MLRSDALAKVFNSRVVMVMSWPRLGGGEAASFPTFALPTPLPPTPAADVVVVVPVGAVELLEGEGNDVGATGGAEDLLLGPCLANCSCHRPLLINFRVEVAAATSSGAFAPCVPKEFEDASLGPSDV